MASVVLKKVAVVCLPEWSLSYRDYILFTWKNLPCSAITKWSVSRGKENTCHPVAENKRRAKLIINGYKLKWIIQTTKRHTFSFPHPEKPSSYSACRSYKGFWRPGRAMKHHHQDHHPSCHYILNTLKTHLPSIGHSFCFFLVNVSFYAGFSSGYENCMPKSQCSQSHSHCAANK